jgi:SET and MYND domain-containing protein
VRAQGGAHSALRSLDGAITAASSESGVDAELLRLVAALAVAQDAPAAAPGAEGAPIRGTIADVASLRAPGDAADGSSPPAAPPPAFVAACAALLRCAGAAGTARLGGRDAAALARLAAVVNGNAHGLGAHRHADGTSGADVAAGLFPFLSMFNHSCAPRAVFAAAAPGGVMGVRALRACAAGDELTVAYVNLYEPRAARRAATLATKGFACDCERCAAPLRDAFDARLQGAACRCGDVCVEEEGDADAAAHGWRCVGCGCVPAELLAATRVYACVCRGC